MKTTLATKLLEAEWELESGFLGRLRVGEFDLPGANRLLKILTDIEISDRDLIDRRFVSLSWYIPLFMSWQRERLKDPSKLKELEIVTNQVTAQLEKLLGVP